jgi:hypothetical protein
MAERDRRPIPAARIEYTIPNATTGEDWASIETVYGNLAAPTATLVVPARQATTVVALINDAHRHLNTAIDKLTTNDPTWRHHISRVASDADELSRTGGRPPKPKGMSAAERQADYFNKTGSLEETARAFDVSEETVVRNLGRARRIASGQ